jgi:hypothetical protein
MSTTTAKFIIHREGLDVFNLRELRDLLTDAHLAYSVKQAIITLTEPQYQKGTQYHA